MIELPEAVTLARQITAALKGKRIESGDRGNAPHKFAFYSRPAEEYAAILPGKIMGEAYAAGACILVPVEPGYALELGGGGERIRCHRDGSALPAKRQLLLQFEDGGYLTVTVQGWGSVKLYDAGEIAGPDRVSPLAEEFTLDHFLGLFEQVPAGDSRSVKFFVISQPGVWGIGNGYLQDILFRAKLNPRKRVLPTSDEERRALYTAIRETLDMAVAHGGRDTELDLFGVPGRYSPILDRRAKGCPCPRCGAPIEAMAYLGGTSYYCPVCQPLP